MHQGGADTRLALSLSRALALVQAGHDVSFALADLGDLANLPEPARPGAAVEAGQLRTLAALYLAAEWEGAGILQAAEALASLARSGALPWDFGDAVETLDELWKSRNERMTRGERLAVFSRMFGTWAPDDDAQGPRNSAFDDRMIDLCDALVKSAEAGDSPRERARVRVLARRLADNLAFAATSYTALVANEIFGAVKLAFALFKHPRVRTALAARDTWSCVAAVDRLQQWPARPSELHHDRGTNGLRVLEWLALQSSTGGPGTGGSASASIDDSVAEAAAAWLQASLDLAERAQRETASSPA